MKISVDCAVEKFYPQNVRIDQALVITPTRARVSEIRRSVNSSDILLMFNITLRYQNFCFQKEVIQHSPTVEKFDFGCKFRHSEVISASNVGES